MFILPIDAVSSEKDPISGKFPIGYLTPPL